MPALKRCSSDELIRFLNLYGYYRKRQRGSHIIVTRPGARRPLVIPNSKELPRSIILSNLRSAGISADEYRAWKG